MHGERKAPMPQCWRPSKGPVVDVDIATCGDESCHRAYISNHRHCPCGCGSVTITRPTGLRACEACGRVCLHNKWNRSSQQWLCSCCAARLGGLKRNMAGR